MRKISLFLFLLLAPIVAHAQSNVQISLGAAYANGSLTIQRLPQSLGFVETRHVFLGSNGDTFISILTPGSMYGFRAVKSDSTGQLYLETLVNGAAQDISAALLASPAGSGGVGSVTSLPATCSVGQGFLLPSGLVVYCGPNANQYTTGDNISQVIQSGLMAEYRILPSETPATLVDYSGNSRNATGTVGTAPTIIATTGGINCGGAGAISLPASLNTALTLQVFTTFLTPGSGPSYNGLLVGNGNGAASNNIGLALVSATTGNYVATPFNVFNRPWTIGNGALQNENAAIVAGTKMVSVTFGANDQVYVNGTAVGPTTGASAGLQTVGNYQLCGAAAGSGFASSTYAANTKIYYVLIYNRVLTATEIQYNVNIVTNVMNSRGVALAGAPQGSEQIFFTGDSIDQGVGASPPWISSMTLIGNPFVWDNGVNVLSEQQIVANGPYEEDAYTSPASLGNFRFATFNWACTNDMALNSRTPAQCWTDMSAWIKSRKAAGWNKVGVQTALDRNGNSANMENFDTLVRANAKTVGADMVCDAASWTFLGASGANANTTYFQAGGVHPTTFADSNLVAPVMQNCVNRLWGNFNFSVGNTYAVTAPAATATTAGSESGSTVTLTFASNPFPAGSLLICTGITPAGYNNTTGVPYFVLTSTATQVTYIAATTGMGAITVQGSCSTPQSVDVDTYATLSQNAAGTHTLLPCELYVGDSIFRRVTSTVAWTITPWGSETINGAATFTTPAASAGNNPVVRLDSILTSASAAGCSWRASLQ